MKGEITIYEKPTCSTCRQAATLLKEMGLDFDKVNYYVEPLSGPKIKELIGKMGISAKDLLRTKEALYRELGLAKSEHSDAELIELMVQHPELMQRPIVERGSRAVLGRPVENIRSFLSESN